MGRETGASRTSKNEKGAKGPKVYNRVRALRREREISREQTSEALGINHRTLGAMERQQYEPADTCLYVSSVEFTDTHVWEWTSLG